MHELDVQKGLVSSEPYTTLSLRLAEEVANEIERNPDCRLGMPTGRTPTGCYKIMSRWSSEGQMDWSKVRCFGLDEYIDVEEVGSYRYFLEQNLFKYTNLPQENLFNPAHVSDYDDLIASVGGLDLTVLGLGKNGHIAFNEPGTPCMSWTHSIWLTESTRQANAEFFSSPDKIPTRAVTMGVQTILASRRILLVVSGAHKKDVLLRALRGPVSAECPASFLQSHKSVKVLTDFALDT